MIVGLPMPTDDAWNEWLNEVDRHLKAPLLDPLRHSATELLQLYRLTLLACAGQMPPGEFAQAVQRNRRLH